MSRYKHKWVESNPPGPEYNKIYFCEKGCGVTKSISHYYDVIVTEYLKDIRWRDEFCEVETPIHFPAVYYRVTKWK